MDSVQVSTEPAETRVVLGTDLEISAIRALYEQLTPLLARPVALALDAGRVERIDAAGLQVLLALCQNARQRRIPLQWQAVSAAVSQAAQRAGVETFLFEPA